MVYVFSNFNNKYKFILLIFDSFEYDLLKLGEVNNCLFFFCNIINCYFNWIFMIVLYLFFNIKIICFFIKLE